MEETPAPLRSHPAVVASVVLAALAVTAFSLVGIAYMMGWVGRNAPATPASIATPGQQLAGTAPDMGLLPGESLVTMPEPPKSAIPPPAPPGGAAIPPPKSADTKAAPPPMPRDAGPAARAAPARPSYEERPSRDERPETTRARIVPDDRGDELCMNCGIVASIAPHGDFWDIVVRYDDGSAQTLRYPERPRLRTGERVHFEDGRLVSDSRR